MRLMQQNTDAGLVRVVNKAYASQDAKAMQARRQRLSGDRRLRIALKPCCAEETSEGRDERELVQKSAFRVLVIGR